MCAFSTASTWNNPEKTEPFASLTAALMIRSRPRQSPEPWELFFSIFDPITFVCGRRIVVQRLRLFNDDSRSCQTVQQLRLPRPRPIRSKSHPPLSPYQYRIAIADGFLTLDPVVPDPAGNDFTCFGDFMFAPNGHKRTFGDAIGRLQQNRACPAFAEKILHVIRHVVKIILRPATFQACLFGLRNVHNPYQ